MTTDEAQRLVEEIEKLLIHIPVGDRAPSAMEEIRDRLSEIRSNFGHAGGVGSKVAEVEDTCVTYFSRWAILRYQDPAIARGHAMNTCGGLRMLLGRLKDSDAPY